MLWPALKDFRRAISKGHHDRHKLRLALRVQVIEDHVGAA
jgi:hypothetical protein